MKMNNVGKFTINMATDDGHLMGRMEVRNIPGLASICLSFDDHLHTVDYVMTRAEAIQVLGNLMANVRKLSKVREV
jgi:hypothetical protein